MVKCAFCAFSFFEVTFQDYFPYACLLHQNNPDLTKKISFYPAVRLVHNEAQERDNETAAGSNAKRLQMFVQNEQRRLPRLRRLTTIFSWQQVLEA